MDGRRCPQGHVNDHDGPFCVTCGLALPRPGPATASASNHSAYVPVRAASGLDRVEDGERHSSSEPTRRSWLARTPRPTTLGWLVLAGVLAGGILAAALLYFVLTKPTPDVVGLAPAQAALDLRESGFEPGSERREFSSTVSKGLVLAQDPQPGARGRAGSVVDLVVSRGPAVHVPNVVGDGATTAQAQLTALELESAVTFQTSETVPKDQVIAQDTVPGTLVEEGVTVRLVVSSGPPTRTVTVTLYLYDGSDSCSFSLGYYDIPGASVALYADGSLVASEDLPFRGVDHSYYCEYTVDVPGVPAKASSYSLEIGSGRRGVLEMTSTELEGEDWIWTATLGL